MITLARFYYKVYHNTTIAAVFFCLVVHGFSQEKLSDPGEDETDNLFIENFYPVEAFLDSSYDVLEFLSSNEEIPVLSTEDALRLFRDKTALFIDARQQDEFGDGHIPNALNIPYDSTWSPKYVDVFSKIEKDEPIVVYCNTYLCIVSKTAAEGIIFNGFRKVIIAEGYWRWEEMGFPVETIPLSQRNKK